MNKTLLLVSFLALSSANAAGFTEYFTGKVSGSENIDGCGLGWQVTDSKTMIGTTTRGTTNMTVPASFGMTSGTLGCDKISVAAKDKEAFNFVASNFQTLKMELSEGQGEHSIALMNSLGCDSQKAQSSLKAIKNSYDKVVVPAQNAAELFNNVKALACS